MEGSLWPRLITCICYSCAELYSMYVWLALRWAVVIQSLWHVYVCDALRCTAVDYSCAEPIYCTKDLHLYVRVYCCLRSAWCAISAGRVWAFHYRSRAIQEWDCELIRSYGYQVGETDVIHNRSNWEVFCVWVCPNPQVELDPSLGGKPRRILKREGVENNELTFDSFRQSLLLWIE